VHRSRSGLVTLAAWVVAISCAGQESRTALGPADGRDLPPADTGRVAVGDLAPDFTLESYDRGVMTLSDFRGSRDILLVFYRGSW